MKTFKQFLNESDKKKFDIEQIPDNYRPEFKKAGFLVHYDMSNCGWKKAKWFKTKDEAEKFSKTLNESVEFDIYNDNRIEFEKALNEPFLKLAKKFSSKVQLGSDQHGQSSAMIFGSILDNKLDKRNPEVRVEFNVGVGSVYIQASKDDFLINITKVPFSVSLDEQKKYGDALAFFGAFVNVKSTDVFKAYQEGIKNIEKLMKEKGIL